MGLFSFIGRILSSDARYNHNLYKTGRADRSKKLYTNIRPDLGRDEKTSSGYVEKSTPIEKKRKR